MATYTDKFSSGWAELQLVVTRESYSTTNNTSYLKCVLKIKKLANASSYNFVDASISMTIAGTKLYYSDEFDIRNLGVDKTQILATKYITVSHNSDGTKSVSCKASFNSGVGLGSASISATYTCGTIPRASSLSLSASSVNVGSSITATIASKSTSFTHDVEFFISGYGGGSNSNYYKKDTGIKVDSTKKKEIKYTIPTTWYNYMSSSTSCTAYCRITTRNSSGTQIGSKVTKSFTAKVPSSIKPDVSKIKMTFNPNNMTLKNGDIITNTLVQKKNGFKLTISGCKPGQGSSIKSYTFSGPGLKETTQSGTSITGGTVSTTGALTYTVTVTDKRGRTATATLKGSTSNYAYCYAYSKPYIESFDVYRVKKNSNGTYTKDADGDYLKCTYTPKYSSVDGTNSAAIYMYYTTGGTTKEKKGANGEVDPVSASHNKTYKIYLSIVDRYNGTGKTSSRTILGASRIMNIRPNGKGIAFGKKSEEDCFECAWTSRLYRSIIMKTNNTGIYGTTINNEDAALLRLSSSNNVVVGSAEAADQTYIHGGTVGAVSIGGGDFTSDLYVTGNITMNKNNAYIYGTTTDNKDASLLRLSSDNNVIVSTSANIDKTYIHGGTVGTVNIGSSGHESNLYVTGTASGPSGFSTSSDKKVKKNIKNLDVDIVDKLQSVEYQLVDSVDDKTHYGFVAQDVIQTLLNAGINPETCGIVGTIQNGEEQQYVLTYTEFIPLLVTKCQTLQSEVDELRQGMAELKRLIT